MKGRNHKMLKRVTVAMLVLALTLSNMSVAAENGGQTDGNPVTENQDGTSQNAAVISEQTEHGEEDGLSEEAGSDGVSDGSDNSVTSPEDSVPGQIAGGEDTAASSDGAQLPDGSTSLDPSVSDGIDVSDQTDTSTAAPIPEADPAASTSPSPEESPAASATPNPEENPAASATPNPEESPAASATPNPEENPAASATPNPEESPAASATPNPEESPAASATPNPEESPAASATPNPEESPAASATPNPEESPAASTTPNPEQEDMDEEEDFSDLMTVEELEALPETEVGATMWKTMATAFFGMRRMAAARSQDGTPEDGEQNGDNPPAEEQYEPANGWEFNTYYVNSDNQKEITIRNDANVKYQMVFHTENALKANTVEIRIPYSLLQYRGEGESYTQAVGAPVFPAEGDIAVPKAPGNDPTNSVYSKNTPFNYYITETDESGNPTKDSELVFFNYRKITAGTNAAWQVLYRNLDIMRIVDGTEWTLPATAVVTRTQTTGGEGTEQPTVTKEKAEPAPLTGKADTNAVITKVEKNAYRELGKQYYTPLLYTEAQVKRYIDGELPEDFTGIDEDGNDNFTQWKYAVWEVTVEGEATQPWNLKISETPGIVKTSQMPEEAGNATATGDCRIVGYRNVTSSYYNYPLVLDESEGTAWKWDAGTNAWTAITQTHSDERTLRSRFQVVVAYPAGSVTAAEDETEADSLSNRIAVTIEPTDDAESGNSASSEDVRYPYKDYSWKYEGDVIGIQKVSNPGSSDEKNKEYDSWLEAYSRTPAGQDYGSIFFSSTGSLRGYGSTHYTKAEENGEIYGQKAGHFYELTTADDFMYAQPDQAVTVNGEEKEIIGLDWQDYYYTGVTITQRDMGYDPMEEAETEVLEQPDAYRESYVYAMFAKPENEGENWTDEDINTWVQVNGGNPIERPVNGTSVSYTFSEAELARQPWRVKVVHRTAEYRTECEIAVNVCLRGTPSDDLQAVMDAYREEEITSVKLQDLSAAMGRYTESNADGTVKKDDSGNPVMAEMLEYDPNYEQYEGITDLAQATKELYTRDGWSESHLPMRSNAYATLYGLRKDAHAFKQARTSNDVTNGRVLVDYYLTAYDSYRVQDQESIQYLKNLGVPTPGKKYVMFYDLLPHSVSFDPSVEVIAGRITQLDANGRYQSQTNYWDDTDINVTTEVLEDWNHTGQDMVVFHIEYTGEDPAVYSSGKWMEGFGICFRANYAWKDMDAVEKQYNISAFMPDVEKYDDRAVELLGSGNVYRETEIPQGSAYQPFAGGINPSNDAGVPNILYAQRALKENMATAGLSRIEKLVRADSDIFAMFKEDAYVEAGKGYTYEITVEAQEADLKDLVVFDHLENAAEERKDAASDPNTSYMKEAGNNIWQGTFRSVELNGLAGLDVDPVVWYSSNRNAMTSGSEGAGTLDAILQEANGWYQEADYIAQYKRSLVSGEVNEGSGADNEAIEAILQTKIDEYKEAHTSAQLNVLISKYKREHPEEKAPGGGELTEGEWEKAAVTKALAMATVQSVAVDFRKTPNGGEFHLEKGRTVSFQIRMQAPEETKNALYAFNNPSYYAANVSAAGGEEDTRGITLPGDSVRVRLGAEYSLEVSKDFEGEVPKELENQSFTFRLYREEAVKDEEEGAEAGGSGGTGETSGEGSDGTGETSGESSGGTGETSGESSGGTGETSGESSGGTGETNGEGSGGTEESRETVQEVPLANKSYTLWVKTIGEGGVESYTQKKDRPYATDEKGCFTLQAGQKAVFDNVADAKDIIVEEAESVYWEMKDQTSEKDAAITGKKIWSHAVTNQYRNVLYVQKKVEGVPEGLNLTKEELTFLFQIAVEGQPLPLTYCLVDGIKTNGDSPKILEFPKETGTEGSIPKGQSAEPGDGGADSKETNITDARFRQTDAEGRFEIRDGWTVALFLDSANANYTLTELYTDEAGNPISDLWVKNDPVSGSVSYNGAAARITNHYRWKDFYLTKELLHQDPAHCNEEFTFQIFKQLEVEEGGQTRTEWVPVDTKNKWTLLEKDGTNAKPGNGTSGENTSGADSEIRDTDVSIEMSRGIRTSGENTANAESNVKDTDMGTEMEPEDETSGANTAGASRRGLGLGSAGGDVTDGDSDIRDEDMTIPGAVLTEGNLDENGIFAARCAGKMIKIEGLEAGVTYKIVEINVPENYQPGYLKNGNFVPFGDGQGLEVTIPVYGDGMKASITNDYLLRPLSVTKQLLSDEQVNARFTMILTKLKTSEDSSGDTQITPEKCEPVSGVRYRVSGQTGPQLSKRTDANGRFNIWAGQTVILEDVGRAGDVFVIWEVQEAGEDGNVLYPQISPAGAGGKFTFGDSGDAGDMSVLGLLDMGSQGDLGMVGPDSPNEVTVGAPLKAELTDEGTEVKFINGTPGLMMIRKVYEDESGEAKKIREDIYAKGEGLYWSEDGNTIYKDLARIEAQKSYGENNGYSKEDFESLDRYIEELKKEISRMQQTDRWNDDQYDVRVHLGLEKEGQIVDWDPTVSQASVTITCIDEIFNTVFRIKGTYDGAGDYSWEILREEAELEYIYRENRLPNVIYRETGKTVWKNDGYDAEAILAFDKGSFNIKPWMTYVIQIGENTGYIVEEQDPYHYDAEKCYVISPKVAKAEGNVSTAPSVTLVNEFRQWQNWEVPLEKRMTPESDPVPAGKELVWCVQRYDGKTKTWKAMEGFEYVILEGNEEDGIYSSSKTIQRTGKDGKIILKREKDENTYLAVRYLKSADNYYLGPYFNMINPQNGFMRIVELLGPGSGTADEWGTLVGYGAEGMNGRYDMDVYTQQGGGIETTTVVNSNHMTTVRVEKRTEQPYGETFTMFLRQLTGSGQSIPRQGIVYDVYDKDGLVRSSNVTGSNGEILLEDGQYAELSLPSEVEWTVSEAEGEEPGAVESFRLEKLTRRDDPEEILQKIDRNLMQINRKETQGEGTTFITKYDVLNGVVDAETGKQVTLKEGDVTIPQYILQNGVKYQVTGISDYAFSSQRLTKVKVPEGVTVIKNYAFTGCNELIEANIPETIKEICLDAFMNCSKLKIVNLPNGIEKIGDGAFWGTALTEVVIPDSITRIESNTFIACTQLESLTLGRNLTEIGRLAFKGCINLKQLVLPSSLQMIDSNAFINCPLEDLTISSDIMFGTSDGRADMAFGITEENGQQRLEFDTLKKLTIDAKIPKFSSKFRGNGSLSDWCPNLEELVITEKGEIDAIDVDIATLPNLKTLTIDGTVGTIGGDSGGKSRGLGVKKENVKLETLTINGEIGTIKENAFRNCTALTKLEINGEVRNIGTEAFRDCAALTTLQINDAVGTINSKAFVNCGLTDFTVGAGASVGAIGTENELSISGSGKAYSELKSLTIDGTVDYIGNSVFSDSRKLETVTISGTVKRIGEYAFSRGQSNQSVLSLEPTDNGSIPELNVFIRNKPVTIDQTAFQGETVHFHLGGTAEQWQNAGYPWGADSYDVKYNWTPTN